MSTSVMRLVALASSLACGVAFAAPSGSVPSVASVGRSVTVTGSGFSPGTMVTIKVSGPNQSVSMGAAAVGADGRMALPIVASQPGSHRIQILDASGSTLVGNLTLVVTP
ncbi:MAG: hypothetical protein Q8N44_05275 [Rubrivivax sp.]|nr:hypothetical protein [Rubrivivax sp.]